jgi:hypothetical protein
MKAGGRRKVEGAISGNFMFAALGWGELAPFPGLGQGFCAAIVTGATGLMIFVWVTMNLSQRIPEPLVQFPARAIFIQSQHGQ